MSTFKIPTFRELLKTSPKCRKKTGIRAEYQKLPKMKKFKINNSTKNTDKPRHRLR